MMALAAAGRSRCPLVLARVLLLATVAVLYLPAGWMLLVAAVFSPLLVLAVLVGRWDSAQGLLMLVAGIWGSWALLRLTLQVAWPQPARPLPWWGLGAGVLANVPLLGHWPGDLAQAWFQYGAMLALALLLVLRFWLRPRAAAVPVAGDFSPDTPGPR